MTQSNDRLEAVKLARQIQAYMSDQRTLRSALDIAEKFALGHATAQELHCAYLAATAVANKAAWESTISAAKAAQNSSAADEATTKYIAMNAAQAAAWASNPIENGAKVTLVKLNVANVQAAKK